jgi:hypothetical protein
MTQLNVQSTFGPALTFWGPSASETQPVIAFVAPGTNQMTLIDPNTNVITPVALIGPPGVGHTIPVICSARPSIATFGNWLVVAWADENGNVNIAGSKDGKVFGDSLSFAFSRLPCAFNTGPCLGHFRNEKSFIGLAIYWIAVGGEIHVTLGTFPNTVPWSPVGTVSTTLIDAPALSTLPQQSNPAEEAEFIAYVLGTQPDGSMVIGGGTALRVLADEGGRAPTNLTHLGPGLAVWYNGGETWIAYTGLDNHLHTFSGTTMPIGPDFPKKYAATSMLAPAIAYAGDGSLWWAWTGTNGNPGFLNFENHNNMQVVG